MFERRARPTSQLSRQSQQRLVTERGVTDTKLGATEKTALRLRKVLIRSRDDDTSFFLQRRWQQWW
jgi:hypothetical protein